MDNPHVSAQSLLTFGGIGFFCLAAILVCLLVRRKNKTKPENNVVWDFTIFWFLGLGLLNALIAIWVALFNTK